MHGSRPRRGHPGLRDGSFGQRTCRVRTRRLHAERRKSRGWRRAVGRPGRRRGSWGERGHASALGESTRSGRRARSREQFRRSRAPQGLRGIRLSFALLPAAHEGPPVAYGLAAHFPAPRLAPVEEAARIYAVAALAAVQLHLGEARRREAGKGKFRGRRKPGLRHCFRLCSRPALPGLWRKSRLFYSQDCRDSRKDIWRKSHLLDSRGKACGRGVLSENITFSCLPGGSPGSGDIRNGSLGAGGKPSAFGSLGASGKPHAAGRLAAPGLRVWLVRRAFAPALPGLGAACRRCGGLRGPHARGLCLGLGFRLLVLGSWGIAL